MKQSLRSMPSSAYTSCVPADPPTSWHKFQVLCQAPYEAMSLRLRGFWLRMCRGPLTTQTSNTKEIEAGSKLEECTDHSGITPLLGRTLSRLGKHMTLAHQGLPEDNLSACLPGALSR